MLIIILLVYFVPCTCRGRAIAVGALQDKIAIFPTSIIAGNNIVEKVCFCLLCLPVLFVMNVVFWVSGHSRVLFKRLMS